DVKDSRVFDASAAEELREVVLLDLENATANIGRVPAHERADIAPVDRTSPRVAPIARDRIRLIEAAPFERVEAMVRQERAMVRGGCAHAIELGQRHVATHEQRLMA